ncbi:dNTP triphosphohydrolase [Clostridium sporogenes]|uniref:deoxyguanosinetriphosphate triphosphohydrolase family protein n=1 Tax=Clostridium sporogenes TaxID=1509 RepID=UPI001C118B46|nr:dNTP triphosphohydrolase [Clostridium sporogenes]
MSESTYGCLAANDEYAERIEEENKHPIRSKFERDRDRIMYSKAFRRLSGKTQVFLAGNDDHARTRLTHTLEVAQIARTITKALGLNEELAEAIALGHDIGHTPFGHVGERMLNSIMSGCYEIRDFNELNIIEEMKGFKHNWQSIRVAADLESSMNLTNYTLWGMLNHSKLQYKKCKMEDKNNKCLFRHEKNKTCNIKLEDETSLNFYRNIKIRNVNLYDEIKEKWSFEGVIVALADEVAQRHHDIEDALEYNIINKKELYNQLDKIFNFNAYKEKIYKENEKKNSNSLKELLQSIEEHKRNFRDIKKSIDKGSLDLYKPKFSKFIVNILTTDIIYNTKNNFSNFIKYYNIKNNQDFYNIKNKINNYKNIVTYSSFMKETDEELEEFLRNRILNSYKAQTMDGVGQHIIKELFKAYLISPQQLPDKTIVKLFENLYKEDKEKLDNYKYEDTSEYNVGELRNILSEYHFNRKKDKKEYEKYKVELLRTICDYIAGMTDKYTIEQHRKLYNIV